MTLTVTVRDNETGEEQSAQVADNDYWMVVTGTCYLASAQTYPAKGTHVLTIKGRRAGGVMWPEAIRLAEIKARWQAATNGPWFATGLPWSDGRVVYGGAEDPYAGHPVCDCTFQEDVVSEDDEDYDNSREDAEFIANARTDIPWLWQQVERLGAVAEAAAALRAFADVCCCEDHEREAVQAFDAALAALNTRGAALT